VVAQEAIGKNNCKYCLKRRHFRYTCKHC